jgi:CRP-like cAMP-binding protein
MSDNNGRLEPLIAKLEALGGLAGADRQALALLPYRIEKVDGGRHLIQEGTRPTECCVLLKGYACRYKVAADGARQIVSFHVAGDILDLQHLHLETADHHVQAITAAEVAWIPKSELRALSRERPQVGEAMWRDSLIDASIFREWVLNVGRRDAKSRIAHMLCEFVVRCAAVGLFKDRMFELPMTQEQIADATGLTPVHVNRMLKALTDEGVLEGGNRSYRVANWERLQQVGEFDRAYLHAQRLAA